jgi:hypothetical protein
MASKQRRRGLPQPNANCDAAKSNADGHVNDHTTSISYADGDGNRNDHTTSVSYANGDSDRYTHNKAYTDAKAAANAASAALSRKRMG